LVREVAAARRIRTTASTISASTIKISASRNQWSLPWLWLGQSARAWCEWPVRRTIAGSSLLGRIIETEHGVLAGAVPEGLGGLRATGKAAYTGIDIDLEWAAIWTIRDGKLTRAQGYLSRADAAEAAGLSE
jgi:hypothetical protein